MIALRGDDLIKFKEARFGIDSQPFQQVFVCAQLLQVGMDFSSDTSCQRSLIAVGETGIDPLAMLDELVDLEGGHVGIAVKSKLAQQGSDLFAMLLKRFFLLALALAFEQFQSDENGSGHQQRRRGGDAGDADDGLSGLALCAFLDEMNELLGKSDLADLSENGGDDASHARSALCRGIAKIIVEDCAREHSREP